MLAFDPARKRLRLDHPRCTVTDWDLSVEADGARLSCREAQVEVLAESPLALRLLFAEVGLAWVIHSEVQADEGVVLLRSTLENLGRQPIALGKVRLLETADCAGLGEPGDEFLCLPLPGTISPRHVYRLSHPDCPRSSKIKLQLYDRAGQKAVQVGFVTFRRANTEVEFEYDPEAGMTRMSAWCDFAGWELGPGESTPAETFIWAVGADPYAQLEGWAGRAASACAVRRWEDAPIGWVGWAWVDGFTVERYEEVVLRNCQAIRTRLAGFGVNHVWVSLGNLAGVSPGDWLSWNRELFPGGPRYLSRRLSEMGFRWGLWFAPFWMCGLLEDKVREFEDALLKNPDGTPMVVRPEWQYGDAGQMPKAERPCVYALDPSHPRALALLREVLETYREWGVRYYMIDFLEAGCGSIGPFAYQDHHDRRLVAGPEAYHHALRVIRQAAGDDTYLLSSSGPTVHNAGAVDAIRTGNDFGEGRALYPDSYFYPATFVINSSSFWTGPQMALLNQASAYYTHRRLYLNDSGNVLTVDTPLALRDAQVHATIHAMSGGPSMLGDDVDRMDEQRLALIKSTLPRSREVAFPVDLFDTPYPDYPKVFHRKVARPWGSFDVVAVYNFGDRPLTLPVELTRLGLDSDTEYLAWEFWNTEYLGRVSDTLDAVVPPGSVRVYRLVESTDAPILLATDMHLLMGEMEVDRCEWDADRGVLTGRAIRPRGERGNVYLHAPPGQRVANPSGLWIAKDARDDSLIIKVALSFEAGAADWEVRFAQLPGGSDMSKLDLT